MCNSLQPHGLQHTTLLCPSLPPTVCFSLCPPSQWCYLTQRIISSSATPCPFAFNLPQHHGLFKWVSSLHQVAKVLELQLQHQSFQWIFRIDFLYDWLAWFCSPRASQESQHHNPKASILQCSAFFMVQLSHLYMTTGKTIALIIWTFVGKVVLLFFNMLSRIVIAFLPRSKHLLISWLQSPSTKEILEYK